jgi:hypothetical protein
MNRLNYLAQQRGCRHNTHNSATNSLAHFSPQTVWMLLGSVSQRDATKDQHSVPAALVKTGIFPVGPPTGINQQLNGCEKDFTIYNRLYHRVCCFH